MNKTSSHGPHGDEKETARIEAFSDGVCALALFFALPPKPPAADR